MSEEDTEYQEVDGVSNETMTLLRETIAANKATDDASGTPGEAVVEQVADPEAQNGQDEVVTGEDQAVSVNDQAPQLASLLGRAKAEEDRIRALREENKADIEAANAYRERVASLSADRTGTLRSIIKDHLGEGADEAAIEAEVKAIYEEMTSQQLGLDVNSPESRQTREVGKLRAELAAVRRRQEQEERKRSAEAKSAEAQSQRAAQAADFEEKVQPFIDEMPYLKASGNAGELMQEYAVRAMAAKLDPTYREAAAAINQHLEQEAQAFYSRFSNLLTPNTGAQQTKSDKAPRVSSESRSSTLTNAEASQRPTEAPKDAKFDPNDPDAWDERTLSMAAELMGK